MTFALYGDATGNTRRAAIALEEAGVAYTLHKVDLARGEQREAEFRALNPRGRVPVLVEDGTRVLTQSNAIMFAIAERTGTLIPEDREARDRCFEWFFLTLTEIIVPSNVGSFIRSTHADAADEIAKRALAMHAHLEERLEGRPYLAGNEFSLADIAAYTLTDFVRDKLGEDLVHTWRWFESVAARPAVQRGMAVFR